MKLDSLARFAQLRNDLAAEKKQLETRLKAIDVVLGGHAVTPAAVPKKRKNKMSAAGRAAIAAAQRARWAKIKAAK